MGGGGGCKHEPKSSRGSDVVAGSGQMKGPGEEKTETIGELSRACRRVNQSSFLAFFFFFLNSSGKEGKSDL